MTACCECVWMHAPALAMRYALKNSGVHWLFFRFFSGGGPARSWPSGVHTNMSSADANAHERRRRRRKEERKKKKGRK